MDLQTVGVTENLTIDSLELAKLSGRRHDVMKKSIERMNEDLAIANKPPAVECLYKDNNKDCTKYILSMYQCKLLAMALDGISRIKVLDRLEELERQQNKPLTYEEVMKNALLLADQRVKLLESKITEDKPKVEFANTVADSSDVILVREYAKLLYDKEGINIGQNKLFEWFRDNGYLNKNNEPYQTYIEYFKIIESTTTSIFGTKIYKTTKITGRGQLYFLSKLKEYFNNL